MLSPQTLERVSNSYREGYYDGYYDRPTKNVEGKHPFDRPFSTFDYDQGYHAGANDAKWAQPKPVRIVLIKRLPATSVQP